VSVKITGISNVLSNLQKVVERVKREATQGTNEAADAVLEGGRSFVPVDTGNLSGSGYVVAKGKQTPPPLFSNTNRDGEESVSNSEIDDLYRRWDTEIAMQRERTNVKGKHRAVIGFTTPYALEQHENTGYLHPFGGESHYLRKGVAARSPEVIKIIVGNIK